MALAKTISREGIPETIMNRNDWLWTPNESSEQRSPIVGETAMKMVVGNRDVADCAGEGSSRLPNSSTARLRTPPNPSPEGTEAYL